MAWLGAAEEELSSAPLVLLPLRSGLLQRGSATRRVFSGNTAKDVNKTAGEISSANQNFTDFSSSPKTNKIKSCFGLSQAGAFGAVANKPRPFALVSVAPRCRAQRAAGSCECSHQEWQTIRAQAGKVDEGGGEAETERPGAGLLTGAEALEKVSERASPWGQGVTEHQQHKQELGRKDGGGDERKK